MNRVRSADVPCSLAAKGPVLAPVDGGVIDRILAIGGASSGPRAAEGPGGLAANQGRGEEKEREENPKNVFHQMPELEKRADCKG
jgi:hypothetical protein